MDVSAVLWAYADLAPAPRATSLDVTDAGPFLWRGAALPLMAHENVNAAALGSQLAKERHGSEIDRLAALDELHREARLIREGWVFLCGPAEVDGRRVRLCLPLISAPVRFRSDVFSRVLGSGPAGYAAVGDRAILPLVTNPERAASLDAAAAWGGGAIEPGVSDALIARLPNLNKWIHDVVAAAGLPPVKVLASAQDPRWHRDGERLVAVVGTGLFVARDVHAVDVRGSLRTWSTTEGIDRTAFAAVLIGEATTHEAPPEDLPSPLPLSAPQLDVVARARTQPVTVVSGPPGSGKSHTLIAVAVDAVARGESVLLATQSAAASDVLAELLQRQPGPPPVLFGDAERRVEIAGQLTGGIGPDPDDEEVELRDRRAHEATERVRWLEGAIGSRLDAELRASQLSAWEPLVPLLLEAAPGALDPGAPLDRLDDLHRRATARATGWFARWRRARAERRLRAATGAGPGVPLSEVGRALQAARCRHDAARLSSAGGTIIGPLWDDLLAADEAEREAVGALVDALARSARGRSRAGRRAVADLGAALRASRSVRRQRLQGVDGEALLDALQLWIGTLRDVDDLLPARAGIFDLVILDEASQIDQLRAAPALLRARRAVIAGDPRQLRHVSFVADVSVEATLADHGLTELAARLDVRRSSVFDVAAGAAPVTWLDEHYRSVPHLIGFSARRFYDDRIHLVTQHPRIEDVDAIEVRQVDGRRSPDGSNLVEVEAVMAAVGELVGDGATSIGVVSPFRAQADALEAALLETYDADSIAAAGLRVGTVHAFQGGERDVVVASLCLTADDPAGSRRFVEDPNLFNVLITRARERMVVVTSLPLDAAGLLGDYLRWAAAPPTPPAGRRPGSAWAAAVHAELERLGLRSRPAYPVGRWSVDTCVGSGPGALAVELDVHPTGSAAHIDRHRTLQRAGWRTTEAFATRFDGDPVRAALTVARAAEEPAAGP